MSLFFYISCKKNSFKYLPMELRFVYSFSSYWWWHSFTCVMSYFHGYKNVLSCTWWLRWTGTVWSNAGRLRTASVGPEPVRVLYKQQGLVMVMDIQNHCRDQTNMNRLPDVLQTQTSGNSDPYSWNHPIHNFWLPWCLEDLQTNIIMIT